MLQALMQPASRHVFCATVTSQNQLQSRKKLVKPTKGSRVGLGGYIFSDYNGIMRRTGGQAVYAYHIPMGMTKGVPNSLSFGLAFTAYQYAINTNGADLQSG